MTQDSTLIEHWGTFEQLKIKYDPVQAALWFQLEPHARPCFNPELLDELRRLQDQIRRANRAQEVDRPRPIRYTVLTSNRPGIFNLGGDLDLFARLIRDQDRDGLFRYAKACIDVLYPNAVGFDQTLTTLSLVRGEALGGGFEAAISSQVVVAEESARFGLPEVLFNLIPGMGAYSFLLRRVGAAVTERIIMSGEVMAAARMYELGLVDIVVADGQGEAAAIDYMRRHERRRNAHDALHRVRQVLDPVTYEELITVTRIWVDAALELGERDLRVIERLVAAQNRCAPADPDSEDGASLAMEGRG